MLKLEINDHDIWFNGVQQHHVDELKESTNSLFYKLHKYISAVVPAGPFIRKGFQPSQIRAWKFAFRIVIATNGNYRAFASVVNHCYKNRKRHGLDSYKTIEKLQGAVLPRLHNGDPVVDKKLINTITIYNANRFHVVSGYGLNIANMDTQTVKIVNNSIEEYSWVQN